LTKRPIRVDASSAEQAEVVELRPERVVGGAVVVEASADAPALGARVEEPVDVVDRGLVTDPADRADDRFGTDMAADAIDVADRVGERIPPRVAPIGPVAHRLPEVVVTGDPLPREVGPVVRVDLVGYDRREYDGRQHPARQVRPQLIR